LKDGKEVNAVMLVGRLFHAQVTQWGHWEHSEFGYYCNKWKKLQYIHKC